MPTLPRPPQNQTRSHPQPQTTHLRSDLEPPQHPRHESSVRYAPDRLTHIEASLVGFRVTVRAVPVDSMTFHKGLVRLATQP